MYKYHDSDYDGVVIKLPKWFIELNGLENTISNLNSDLLNCKYSLMLPDYERTLYEIENYKNKSEDIKSEKELANKLMAQRKIRYDKIASGEIKILQYKKSSYQFDRDIIYINDISFNDDDYFTNKCNIKTSFIIEIKNKIKTFEDFKSFLKLNNLLYHFIDIPEEFVDWNNMNFSCTRHNYCLQITIDSIWLQVVNNVKDGSYNYYLVRIYKENDTYFILNGNDKIYFDGYYKHNMELIKKSK